MSSKPSAYVRTSSSQNNPQLKPTARSETSAATLSARLKMSNLEDNMIALGRKISIDPKRIDTSLGKRKRSDASTASPTVPVAGSSRLAPSARPLQVSSDNNKGTPLEIAKASQSEPLMRPQTRNEDLPIASSPSNTSTLVPHQTLQTNESISMDISPSPPRMANIDLPEPPSVVSPQAENRPPSDIPSVHKFLASIIPEE
ncbi:hypothetical protein SISNIDRAFT_75641 [Sistotremastrum niveocremeum HHB9708]|uniref:Uncharacterized protein n=1 Tax=Sistotremastrum niveocremeum HHB9708 TaxID=1314777 RepID=A0A164UIV3_9AGAM|nr:hypothetical protein SISNIDRAFT_75641 [Sistotremastrum niveocremeum HHB9708]